MNRRHFLYTAAAGAAAFHARAEPPRHRVAIIGHTGRGDYGHGLNTMWLGLPETEVAGVADPAPKGLAACLEKTKCKAGFADYREMLSKATYDLVAICPRWVGQHRDMVLAAVESGVKGIYMEKPFCRTPAEADEIIAACEKKNVKLALAHRNRWDPSFPTIQKFIADGQLGRLLEIRTRGKEDARGGCVDLWVLGSHVLNMAVAFTGTPTACTATIYKDGKPATSGDVTEGAEELGPVAGNAIHARWETESGVPIFFESIAGAGERGAGFGLQLIGTKGTIHFAADATPLASYLEGNPFKPIRDPRAWVPFTSVGPGAEETFANLRAQLVNHVLPAHDLLDSIRDNRQPLVSAYDGRLSVEMITAALASHTQNSARISLPLTSRTAPLATWKA